MLTCDQHDYIEIVCTYQYPITLTLKSGLVVTGVGLDTQYDQHRRECIKLMCANDYQSIALDDIARLEVDAENPHFRSVALV